MDSLYSQCSVPVAATPSVDPIAPTIAEASQNHRVVVQRLGLSDYETTWAYQEQLLAATLAIKAQNRQATEAGTPVLPTPNYLLLCQHPHVYTLGKSGKPEHLLLDEAALQEHQATFHRINRGGDITYHGPGQLVGYPILDLDNFFTDIHRYLRVLEEAVIRTLSEYELVAGRIPGLTGVWLDFEEGASNPRKICALGVKCSRWVTMHGFALNVNTDLSYFGHIVPCGISDKAVTSLQQELGRAVPLSEVEDRLLIHLADLFAAQFMFE
ncbi:lipoyl(octanoyl) transferase LipB [Hymenobacter sp. GOD-10R]|uniref:lipoyl(octanoyl) transferase LipB n=1 Tax=Hymenobacter sp. GOD-10R TaxID=3093922 RepID=UPI002D79F3CC|nr:lipoyl(octanoyl) transferase LipB [Hymenobacter sp. GOD-10R]WRQ27931.1 lipoyl(octanoyl) transferase LipB [Hymenobacter sp. GOD-10R]